MKFIVWGRGPLRPMRRSAPNVFARTPILKSVRNLEESSIFPKQENVSLTRD